MPRKVIRVGLVDDKAISLLSVEKKIKHIAGARLTLFAQRMDELSDKLRTLQANNGPLPHIILMDIQLAAGEEGYSCTYWLKDRYPEIHVIGYSDYGQPETVQRLLHAGACAFIEKGKGAKSLQAALFDVYETGRHLNDHVDEAMLAALGDDATERFDISHPQTALLMQLLATDLNSYEIGDLMCMAESTVRKHVKRLHHYFGVTTTKAMVAQAFWHGLMPNGMPDRIRALVEKAQKNKKSR